MKELLAAFKLTLSEFRTKANSSLSGLGPVDQFEGSQEVSYALKNLKWGSDRVEEIITEMDTMMAGLDAKFTEAATPIAAALIEEKITAGELINKTDHALAIVAAEKKGEEVAAERFAAEREEATAAAARREEVTTKHGAEVAAGLPDNVFAADIFNDTAKAEIARRVDVLTDLGVVAAEKPEVFAEFIAAGEFTEEGNAAFNKRTATLKQLIGDRKPATVAATKPGKPLPAGSGQPPLGTVAATTESATEKKVACF